MNMYLRWMVHKDDCGVDFGIWKNIAPSQLIIPLDVQYTTRYGKKFNPIQIQRLAKRCI